MTQRYDRDGAIPLAALEEGPQTVRFEANEALRKQIGERLDLSDLKSFSVAVTADRRDDGDILLNGRVAGEAERLCVASLEPFIEVVEDDFEIRFSKDAEEVSEADAPDHEFPENEAEPMPEGVIDVVEIGVQYFSLALLPHPRKPGVEALADPKAAEEAAKLSPFAKLQDLKKS